MAYNDDEKDLTEGPASRASSSDDLEQSPLASQERFPQNISRRRKWRCTLPWPSNESPVWKYWALLVTMLSAFLLPKNIMATHPFVNTVSSSPSKEAALRDYPHPVETWKADNLIETQYYRDTRYMTLDHDADWLWQEYLLMSTGNIRIPDGKGNTSLKSISMYHQMHCLAKMRLVLQEARQGIIPGKDYKDDAHWPHCFDYLRSSIMCFADGTLESVSEQPAPEKGKIVKVIDGGYETRYCRDTRPLENLERQYAWHGEYTFEDTDVEDFQVAPGR